VSKGEQHNEKTNDPRPELLRSLQKAVLHYEGKRECMRNLGGTGEKKIGSTYQTEGGGV